MKMRVIFAEMNTSWVVMKLKLKKNHACTRVEPMTSAESEGGVENDKATVDGKEIGDGFL